MVDQMRNSSSVSPNLQGTEYYCRAVFDAKVDWLVYGFLEVPGGGVPVASPFGSGWPFM